VAVPSARPVPTQPAIPAIETGTVPQDLAQEGEAVLAVARERLEAGDYQAARTEAQNVIRRYPSVSGSGEALEILARASLSLGDLDEAREASGGFLGLLDPSHPAYPGALALAAEILAVSGNADEAASLLLRMPAGADRGAMAEALDLLRETLGDVERDRVQELAASVPQSHPMWTVLAVQEAIDLYLAGDRGGAERLASTALERGPGPREAEVCRAILGGTLEELLGRPVVLGAILPQSGVSPGALEYAEAVLEGIRVAVQEFQGTLRRPVEVEVRDDEGRGDLEGGIVREMEAMGAVGVVGPMTEDLLAAAVDARGADLAIISPFATLSGSDSPGVFSLSGPDPRGAEAVARYAWDLGLERVMVLRPGSNDSQVEGDAFREAFLALGGSVPRELVYSPGATFFQTQFDQVASILPDGLFLPLPPQDIQLLAPQFTFFGLDTLGIQVLGTDGWTEDQVVLEVDSRHTDGVIASTTRLSQDETEAFRTLREGYESLFQKTLRSQVPAYGYDAAALLLTALQDNPRTPAEVVEALDGIRDFPGATGNLTVEDGRIVRDPHLVRIQNHELIYISRRFD